ncbi:MAG: pilin [Casimicrobiaceae bacterium]
MPWESPLGRRETVVPPSRAVQFHLALGPGADRYVPRFIGYERAGRALPGWHWGALFFGGAWACYRRLWLPATGYAALSMAGAAAFVFIEPDLGDSPWTWVAVVALLVWLVPGVLAALFAHMHLYGRVKRLVARAEAFSEGATGIAKWLAARRPTAAVGGAIAGLSIAIALSVLLVPRMNAMLAERNVRTKVATLLTVVEPLQQQVESSWSNRKPLRLSLQDAAMLVESSGNLLESISVNPANGRLSLVLGSAVAELAGHQLLLAPTMTAPQQLAWICVPVGIAAKFLPVSCR